MATARRAEPADQLAPAAEFLRMGLEPSRRQIDIGDRGGVARTLRLGALTGGHVPLAHALQRRPQFSDERTGTLLPLAALRPDEWLDLAYTHGTPNGLAMTPAAYAEALSASVERQYPTADGSISRVSGQRANGDSNADKKRVSRIGAKLKYIASPEV